MSTPIRLLMGAAVSAAAILAVLRFGGLERRARADVARARILAPAFGYAKGPAAGDPGPGAVPAGDGWVVTPLAAPGTPVTDADIDVLPEPARRYFRHANVAGKSRIASFSVILEGRIRNGPADPWMPLVMRQYNRLDNPARVVFLTSTKPPMNGIDSFLEGRGRMLIKAMDLIKVVDSRGPEMAVSAFVTFLNDLTLCPLAYFSLPILWRQAGPDSVELSIAHAGMTVSAVMTVDAEGRPVDWRSEDRYADVKGRSLKDRWSTPFEGSKEIAGLRIPEKGAGIHDYDGNPYVYVELDRIHTLVLDAENLPDRP
ncbi:MAG: hypothetical protein GX430_10350 [Treponema sp.]|nr:hypothetical protein [Treponema sp.]